MRAARAFPPWDLHRLLSGSLTVGSADPGALAAVDGEQHSGDEACLIGRKKEGRVRDVPGGAHLAAERDLAVALLDQLLARNAARPGDTLDRHRRVHEPREDRVRA